MATVLTAPEQRVLLRNIDWQTYEGLLAAHCDSSAPRFTYDRGLLEIMSPAAEHEKAKDLVVLVVNVWAEELGLDIAGFGSTTFQRKDLERGFEPDACFYVRSVERVRAKTKLDLAVDPPPDLVIEIGITSPSIDKLRLYAAVGVPEVWRYNGKRVATLKLEGPDYIEREESEALSGLSGAIVSRFLEEAITLPRPEWLRQLRKEAVMSNK